MNIRKDSGCISLEVLKSKRLMNSKITLQFPKDDTTTTIKDYGFCESPAFFSDFGKVSANSTLMRKHAIIHVPKFNLDDIPTFTNLSTTESVTIYADTIYMTRPLETPYFLNMRARIVSISHPITMVYDRNRKGLPESDGILSKYVKLSNGLVMRQRKFGLIDIVDKHDIVQTSSKCLEAENSPLYEPIDDWLDTAIINMLYMCSHILLAEDSSSELANDIKNFMLNFYGRRSYIKHSTNYITGLKFMDLHKYQDSNKLHYIPDHNLEDTKSLFETLRNQFVDFWTKVQQQETHLFNLNLHLMDSNQDFDNTEMMMLSMLNSEKKLFLSALDNWNASNILASNHRYLIKLIHLITKFITLNFPT